METMETESNMLKCLEICMHCSQQGLLNERVVSVISNELIKHIYNTLQLFDKIDRCSMLTDGASNYTSVLRPESKPNKKKDRKK